MDLTISNNLLLDSQKTLLALLLNTSLADHYSANIFFKIIIILYAYFLNRQIYFKLFV